MKKTRFVALVLALILCASLFSLQALAGQEGPTANDLELTTYKDVSVGGRLSADDPNGQALRFEITTQPVKGTVELRENGSFVYTPKAGKKGRDYFGFVAFNEDGQRSQEATVIIRIQKQKTAVTYSDMNGSGSEYAAVMLAEQGIYTGVCAGGSYLFEPEKEVSRAEFLAMCLSLNGTKLLKSVMNTGFADDEAIPVWARSYVSTALKEGYISGYTEEGRTVFRAEQPVTRAEAAVMLSEVLGLRNVVTVTALDSAAVPVWAAGQTSGLIARGIMEPGEDMGASLCLEDCAVLLSRAAETLN